MIATDGALYLGYCSRSSVIKIAEGFSHARGLLFDSISELYFIDNIGRSINIPTKILLGEVLDSNACFLKVGVKEYVMLSVILFVPCMILYMFTKLPLLLLLGVQSWTLNDFLG